MTHRAGTRRSADAAPEGGGPTGGTRGERRLSRRRALATGGVIAVGSLAGCFDAVMGGGSREEVSPEAPDGTPEGTPAEFHYALEETGIDVEDLYLDTDDDDLILFYASRADDHGESVEEILDIYETFRTDLVDPGTEVEHLYTEVSDGYDEQAEGWGVNAEWAEDELAGDATTDDVLYAIETTKVYPDGEEPTPEAGDEPIEIVSDDEVVDLDAEPTTNETDDLP